MCLISFIANFDTPITDRLLSGGVLLEERGCNPLSSQKLNRNPVLPSPPYVSLQREVQNGKIFATLLKATQ